MEILGKLFGSTARVKMLRLFLFNPEEVFESKDVTKRVRITPPTARREISSLSHLGLIKKKTCYKEVTTKKGNKEIVIKKKVVGWALDNHFPYLEALETFLLQATSLDNNEIIKRLNRAGSLSLVVVSGVFIRNWDSRLDILIVGSKVNKAQLAFAIKDMEAELGKELRYAIFTVPDFKYRVSVYDKLIRDVLDYPHETIIDRIGVSK